MLTDDVPRVRPRQADQAAGQRGAYGCGGLPAAGFQSPRLVSDPGASRADAVFGSDALAEPDRAATGAGGPWQHGSAVECRTVGRRPRAVPVPGCPTLRRPAGGPVGPGRGPRRKPRLRSACRLQRWRLDDMPTGARDLRLAWPGYRRSRSASWAVVDRAAGEPADGHRVGGDGGRDAGQLKAVQRNGPGPWRAFPASGAGAADPPPGAAALRHQDAALLHSDGDLAEVDDVQRAVGRSRRGVRAAVEQLRRGAVDLVDREVDDLPALHVHPHDLVTRSQARSPERSGRSRREGRSGSLSARVLRYLLPAPLDASRVRVWRSDRAESVITPTYSAEPVRDRTADRRVPG